MVLLTLKAGSNLSKVLLTGCLIFTLFPTFGNDLDVSSALQVGGVKTGESHVIQSVSSVPAVDVVPEVRLVPNQIDETGVTNYDEGFSGQEKDTEWVPPSTLGPVITELKTPQGEEIPLSPSVFLLNHAGSWFSIIAPFLDDQSNKVRPPLLPHTLLEKNDKAEAMPSPAKILVEDKPPSMPRIAILIDDLGYSRQGMESSLALPTEVALAILPSTPFAFKTADGAQKQQRVTLLHAPMENQRELKLGPGGLYAKMTKEELQSTLNKDIDGLPGIQGVNNHMGSLLTTRQESMDWVMETLSKRSLFFIDSLTSPKSVARKTAEDHGLKTVSRDVFLDNIRTEKAIDRQFDRLIKLARRSGSALAIGHPYPETMAYLKKRLQRLDSDGVKLVPLIDVLLPSKIYPVNP